MTDVLYERAERVACITLNRPDVRNAVSRALLRGLNQRFDEALADDKADIILLRGAGQDFCAGEDLSELEGSPPDEGDAIRIIEGFQNITRHIMLGPKVVVCAVRGWAIGGGGAWPLNADFTVWADDSRLRFPESHHGLYASGGATFLLEKMTGSVRAREMLWLGRVMAGEQLVQAGLASKLVPAGSFDAGVEEMLGDLLSLPGGSLKRYKSAQAGLIRTALEAALRSESDQMLSAAGDYREKGTGFSFVRN